MRKKNYCAKPKRNSKEKRKIKGKQKRVKGKTPNQQPPEKAKHIPKLPPTNNSEVNLPTYTSVPTLNLPPKNPLRLQKICSETSKDQYSKVTPSLALPKDHPRVFLMQNSSKPQVI